MLLSLDALGPTMLMIETAKRVWDRFWKGTLITMGIIISQFITTVVVVGIQCRPIGKYWEAGLSGRCVDITAFFYCKPYHPFVHNTEQ